MEICLRVKGRVQGVGYRYWIIKKVQEIGQISGYVHNNFDGDVIIYASASEDKLIELQKACYIGPLFARVDNIENDVVCKNYFPIIENGVFKRI